MSPGTIRLGRMQVALGCAILVIVTGLWLRAAAQQRETADALEAEKAKYRTALAETARTKRQADHAQVMAVTAEARKAESEQWKLEAEKSRASMLSKEQKNGELAPATGKVNARPEWVSGLQNGSPIVATGLDPAQYAPTGYPNVSSYPNAHLYPAKLEVKEGEYLPWTQVKLPKLLPLHGVRVKNRMPQLAVLFDAAEIKDASGTPITFEDDASLGADELEHRKYAQMYEPTAFHAIETGVMDSVPSNCLMTFPKKGLKVYSVTYADGTKKTIAALHMLGPYGNEKRFNCFPHNLLNAFTFSNPNKVFEPMEKVGSLGQLGTGYLQSFEPGGEGFVVWDDKLIQRFVDEAVAKEDSTANYVLGQKRLYNVFDKPEYSPKGKDCLVLGSHPDPWVEAILYSYGAAHIMTSEYQVPVIPADGFYTKHMATIHHEQLLAKPKLFDMIVVFSSIEHDGLGRYHDPLSPGADLQQARNLHDLLKPGGLFIVEQPQPSRSWDDDAIVMNEHRIYGTLRFPLMHAPFVLEGLFMANGDNIAGGRDSVMGGYDKKQSMINKQKRTRDHNTEEEDEEDAVAVLRKSEKSSSRT